MAHNAPESAVRGSEVWLKKMERVILNRAQMLSKYNNVLCEGISVIDSKLLVWSAVSELQAFGEQRDGKLDV